MNKKSFLAQNWFTKEELNRPEYIQANLPGKDVSLGASSLAGNSALAPFIKNIDEQSNSNFSKFFTPGWNGNALLSKEIKEFQKVIEKIHSDVKRKIEQSPRFSKKIRMSIFEEFLSYVEYRALNCEAIDNFSSFWEHVSMEDSPYQETIQNFLNIYSFRVAVIYLLKVRFILTLMSKTGQEFEVKHAQYPNSYITNVFKQGSRYSLNSKAFEQNVFSWYSPSTSLQEHLISFKKIIHRISIHEIIKTFSIKNEQILQCKTSYSHTISNLQFGRFLNSLLINFPVWLRSFQEKSYSPYLSESQKLEIISCHYSGDYLESLSQSHWLAQNSNKEIKWEQVLCPDFIKNSFSTGQYLNIFNELQFLTFLAKIGEMQGHDARSYLCDIYKGHKSNKLRSEQAQPSLWQTEETLAESNYDRVILNLARAPRSNPQHHLITSISQQLNLLKEEGYLFVLSNKKLFVASQKQKIESLLKVANVEAIISTDSISGKGEIPSYIYVISKKSVLEKRSRKQSCFRFRLSADLNSFYGFSQSTQLINTFMQKFLGDPPPMHQSKAEETKLEFFQDAVIDGRLIHSSNKDSSKITHPLFFEKLMKVCRPLDYFFDLQDIDFSPNSLDNTFHQTECFFDEQKTFEREKPEYTLIVDQRGSDKTIIEIISTFSLEAKAYEYGHSNCFYFYAYPKWPSLSVQSVRDYLQSPIGGQVIDLTFNNQQRKIKRNLAKLLLPIYFAQNENLPTHIQSSLQFLNKTTTQLLESHPREIEREFKKIDFIIDGISKDYPGQVFTSLASFKQNIQKSVEQLSGKGVSGELNFNNPIIKTPLLLAKKNPIYPHNNEVYVQFDSDSVEKIHLPLTRVSKEVTDDDGDKSYAIKLFSGDALIASIYSSESLIDFIYFLTAKVTDVPISALVQGISVPSISDLDQILESSFTLHKELNKISDGLPALYSRLINSIIAQ